MLQLLLIVILFEVLLGVVAGLAIAFLAFRGPRTLKAKRIYLSFIRPWPSSWATRRRRNVRSYLSS